MSDIVEELSQGVRRPAAEVLADIEAKGLATAIREETWKAHGRAEFSAFEQALVKGTITFEAYADLMAQTYFIYDALEETTASLVGHPVAGSFVFPELARKPALEADLAFYYGEGWRDAIEQLPVTVEYVARIKETAANEPHRWVSHHYTRYLADLSGGFVIDKGITRAFNLTEDGRRFYVFDQIADPKVWKDAYRVLLDELPVTPEQQLEVIDEALTAYIFNIRVIDELSTKHDPFENDITVVD